MLMAMAAHTQGRTPPRDPESRALRHLARATRRGIPERPLDALQQVADLARELTCGLYAALAVTDDRDNVQGFVVSGLDAERDKRLKAPPQGHGPLGTMRKDGRPVRIDNLGEHVKAFGFPPQHPAMTTLLGVPIWVGSELRGALYVTDRDGGKPFRDADLAVLTILSRHAASVIADRWY